MRKVVTPPRLCGATPMAAGGAHGGFRVPKGDVVGLCSPTTNADGRYWQNPTEFDPNRYAPGGAEADTWSSRSSEHGPNTAKMLSFGGGHHMCTGRRFAYLQISTIWSILLRDFNLELLSEVPPPNYNDMVVGPKGPINVRYTRKKKI